MTAHTIPSTISRRLLVNFAMDPEVIAPLLPSPFRPQLVAGTGVGGICFLRLDHLRPPFVPRSLGIGTENVAHRFAVEWDDDDGVRTGVYVPRRDTNSLLTVIGGGRVFEGEHSRSTFDVLDTPERIQIRVEGTRDPLRIEVTATPSTTLGGALFESTDAATAFFRRGNVGFSPNARRGVLEGVSLACARWEASPVEIVSLRSSYFDDRTRFPRGSCVLDSGMVMRDLEAHWRTEQTPRDLRADTGAAAA